MSIAPKSHFTIEEYLELERAAEYKSEYLNGEIFAMAGTTRRHALLITNLSRRLDETIENRPCNVYTTDVRLGIPKTGLYTYPDVMVTCGEEQVQDQTSETLLNPVLIIEVLSESTKDYDRGEKFEHYRGIPSLREYLTVAQDRVHIEQWVRQPDDRWLLTEHSDSPAAIHLASIAVDLKILEIYAKVNFTASFETENAEPG